MASEVEVIATSTDSRPFACVFPDCLAVCLSAIFIGVISATFEARQHYSIFYWFRNLISSYFLKRNWEIECLKVIFWKLDEEIKFWKIAVSGMMKFKRFKLKKLNLKK